MPNGFLGVFRIGRHYTTAITTTIRTTSDTVTSPPPPSNAPVRLGQHVLEHWVDPLLQHRERLLGQRLLVHARVLGVELPEMDGDLVESRPEDETSSVSQIGNIKIKWGKETGEGTVYLWTH